jgi:hypothetical protein
VIEVADSNPRRLLALLHAREVARRRGEAPRAGAEGRSGVRADVRAALTIPPEALIPCVRLTDAPLKLVRCPRPAWA